jgi:opacity protein-like surface antigen
MKKMRIHAAAWFMLMSCISIGAHAQATLGLGIRGGINFANAALEPLGTDETTSGMTGAVLGAVFEYAVNDMVAFQAQPAYCRRGVAIEYPFLDSRWKETAKLAYLEIPLLVKLNFGTTNIKPYLFAGLDVAILMSAKGVFDTDGQSVERDLDKGDFNNTDLGLDVGAGMEYRLDRSIGLFLDARYSMGITDINIVSDRSSWKSRDIKICAGVLFRVR